jgi:hypothetical protein
MHQLFKRILPAVFSMCTIVSTTIVVAQTIKEAEIKQSFPASADPATLIKVGDDLLLSSKTSPTLYSPNAASSANGELPPAQINYHWKRVYSAISDYNGKLFMLCKDDGIVYTADGLGGGETPFFDLKKCINETADKTKARRGELVYDYLAYNGKELFCIILKGYSSSIVGIDPSQGTSRMVSYTQGDPAGLFFSNDTVWYVGNGKNNDVYSRIIGIPLKGPIPAGSNSTVEIKSPFKGLTNGITVKQGSFYSLNRADNRIYQFNVK